MTAFKIKLIAIITMVIDHIGIFFFPDSVFLRMLGRLSFPLFAFLIANGAHHTRDINSYLKRIFIFALISQVPFYLAYHAIDPSFWRLNILFTFFLGLCAILVFQKTSDKRFWLLAVLGCSLAAYFLRAEYSVQGVLAVIFFYLFYQKFSYLLVAQSLLFIAPGLIQIIYGLIRLATPGGNIIRFNLEPLGLLSLVFIAFYNHKRGPKMQYLFYVFYPLQFLVYYLVLLVQMPK